MNSSLARRAAATSTERGGSYYPLRSGWSYAAYLSSIQTLVEHFGFEPPSDASTAQSGERGATPAPGTLKRDRDLGP